MASFKPAQPIAAFIHPLDHLIDAFAEHAEAEAMLRAAQAAGRDERLLQLASDNAGLALTRAIELADRLGYGIPSDAAIAYAMTQRAAERAQIAKRTQRARLVVHTLTSKARAFVAAQVEKVRPAAPVASVADELDVLLGLA